MNATEALRLTKKTLQERKEMEMKEPGDSMKKILLDKVKKAANEGKYHIEINIQNRGVCNWLTNLGYEVRTNPFLRLTFVSWREKDDE